MFPFSNFWSYSSPFVFPLPLRGQHESMLWWWRRWWSFSLLPHYFFRPSICRYVENLSISSFMSNASTQPAK